MKHPNKDRIRLRLRGRVQGVGFRWTAVQRARELRVDGWVRNLPDGSVEVEAEGEAEQVARFRGWLQRGPSGAVVQEVEELPAGTDVLMEFEIRRA